MPSPTLFFKKYRALALVVITWFSTSLCYALDEKGQCEFNGINYDQAKTFVSQLKEDIQKNDADKISELISYPLRVNTGSRHGKTIYYFIKTKKEFLHDYPTIFTEKNKARVLRDQSIFCNYQGGMLADGFIWFEMGAHQMVIFSINK